MTDRDRPTPDVPLRFEHTVEVPGTPEQVWQAIATGAGITAWMMQTDLEEREGGAVAFHMGPDVSSEGTVSGWDPPHRIEYVEPEWAALGGQDPSTVTPLVTEFLVEATSGGTCIVRVVSSAFGTGADWEQEFFDQMGTGWRPAFDTLRRYLERFAGQEPTVLEASGTVPDTPDAVWTVLRAALGADGVGARVSAAGVTGTLERITDPITPGPHQLHVGVEGPVPGYLDLMTYPHEEAGSNVLVSGRFFTPDPSEARAFVDRIEPEWKAWIEALSERDG